ncbi:GNAT family N-acetyltransferase [Roseobacter weihaiensis]|uniref:GNAT family N-acetyltransferase n=1 Tax=Roseobacter weihaiensis TaxID=2763262 RepID=UPI001D0BA9D8|nr:GNAT family N-acetyltransferase [Roseobacter sp. H9]
MPGLPLIRPLTEADTAAALVLYNTLTFGPETQDVAAFRAVLHHPGTTVLGAEVDQQPRAMVTLHLMPNVTWGGRPYGLIENVVTAREFRHRGLGKALLHAAADMAWARNAYKLMLMTGRKRGAKGFYEAAGFSAEDKFAMVLRPP